MRHSISLFLLLALFWLLNSGHYTNLMLSLGVISTLFVLYLVHRMDVVDHESQPIHMTLKFPTYFAWLIKEIILSNYAVVKHIWLGNKSISPTLRVIKASQKSDIGKLIYANSITLTPGTVTVDLHGDDLIVHALCRESIEELEVGDMDQRVSLLEN